MSNLSRRSFIKLVGGLGPLAAAGSLAGCATGGVHGTPGKGARIAVVGGGFGGATCARYLRQMDPNLQVVLIEANPKYFTCPFSNTVLAGLRNMDDIAVGYDGLRAGGVRVVHDTVTAIDPERRQLRLAGGATESYDRLVMAPGIDMKWNAIPGYDEAAAEIMPHAWKAGPQTLLLKKKLESMDNGGVVVIAAPANPFRCPPGPYERASMIAHYLKQHKPRSKIILLDAKDAFAKKDLFMDAWNRFYPNMIEWVPGAKGGKVTAVSSRDLVIETEFEKYKAAVANIIPPQRAGSIAAQAGLTDDSGWCPVNPNTFESKKHAGIYVIGDSSIAGALPKSGSAANSEGKVCAAAIVAALGGTALGEPSYANACYSLMTPDYSASGVGVYRVTDKGIVMAPGAGGDSPREVEESVRGQEARFAVGWYRSIRSDAWGQA